MKRLFVLGLVPAILAVGFTAFADPIVVGGSFTTSSYSRLPSLLVGLKRSLHSKGA